jgi:hypothetical protein
MSFTVPVAEPETAEEVRARVRAQSAKKWNPGVFKAKPLPEPVTLIPLPPPPLDYSETAVIRRTAKRIAAALHALDYDLGSRKHAMLIVRRYATEHDVTVQEILMPSRAERAWIAGARRAPIVRARHKAMAGVYLACRWPIQRIGKFFGGRDHTTVLSALYKLGVKDRTARGRPTIPLNVIGSIVQAMLAKGHERRPASRIAEKYGVGETSVRRIMHRYWKKQAARGRQCG